MPVPALTPPPPAGAPRSTKNDNLDAPKSQNKDPELNPGQNLLWTARPIGWEPNNPLLIDKVVASPPGPKPLVVPQDSSRKPPVQNAGNSPEVPTLETGGLLNEMHKSLDENYSKIPQSPGGGTKLEEAPNTQIDKQKDLKSSHPKATSGKLPVPSATLSFETPMPICPSPENPTRSSDPLASLPAMYRLQYPLKPEYKDYTADNILARDSLVRTTELTRYNQEGPWYVTKLCLFGDKYNFLPAYQIDMKPPVTPKPMPASASKLPLDHTNKLFGIVYITLTGVIDTIVPATGLWLWLGKSKSCLIKLAPILWWALPTQSATRQFLNTSEPANQGWFPDIN
ncbi:hypothetical protein DSO57_1034257 [Entomophthora muscae]|uniref:Uncharacterized protein n=1 Tax=Entomophthora muscae TaxID=34485 RepID=A0ACC2REN0_9FUNG|nr:hypothetical protein DSO57_1034257 [Entomophthora muscae]